MQAKFSNNDGSLTDYALSCGYIEEKQTDSMRVTMWKEHGVYHVRSYDKEFGIRVWDSFDTLSAARKAYNAC